ncbi:hypothetical protein EMCRGX_G030158 [Ephydatia muelleri]
MCDQVGFVLCTVHRPTFFTKAGPDKQLFTAWAVLHTMPTKGPVIHFYTDEHKDSKHLRKEKIELHLVKGVSRMLSHPIYTHCFTLKFSGSKTTLFNVKSKSELESWISTICKLLSFKIHIETVIWEYLDDGGLWQAFPDEISYNLETHYCQQILNFAESDYHYNLSHMTRFHSRTKHTQRVKRAMFLEEQPDDLRLKMVDLPAIWEWGDAEKGEWHPFERSINIQIEGMHDSGSQWLELTLCLPSPMPFLLDLHSMKMVNFRTAVKYNMRREINQNYSAVPITEATDEIECSSPSSPTTNPQAEQMGVSPINPLFQPIQDHLQQFQIARQNIKYKQMIGEGAFGDVHLAEVSGLRGFDRPADVAVKQLRLSDFIARHGHHSQQMEDFLREAKEMAKVNHPRVVKLLGVCTLDYPLLLIEEYMNQGDLLAVLKDSRPSLPLVTQLKYASHVADGMNYLASELNCVHRDLAARNILVHKYPSGEVEAKIADFGLSRHLYSDMYKHTTSKPRPLPAKWMALESLMYFIFTTRSDVWSYGVLLWEIMTLGRAPYPGVENRELLEQIEEKGLKLTRPKPCPNAIFEVILKCIEHTPESRPTFAALKDKMCELLKQAEQGTLVCEDEPTPPVSAPPPVSEPPPVSAPPPPPSQPLPKLEPKSTESAVATVAGPSTSAETQDTSSSSSSAPSTAQGNVSQAASSVTVNVEASKTIPQDREKPAAKLDTCSRGEQTPFATPVHEEVAVEARCGGTSVQGDGGTMSEPSTPNRNGSRTNKRPPPLSAVSASTFEGGANATCHTDPISKRLLSVYPSSVTASEATSESGKQTQSPGPPFNHVYCMIDPQDMTDDVGLSPLKCSPKPSSKPKPLVPRNRTGNCSSQISPLSQ